MRLCPRVDPSTMRARMVLAALLGLALPMTLFIAVLDAASEPQKQLVVERIDAPVEPQVRLDGPDILALPAPLRDALEAAAAGGVASVRLDAALEAALMDLVDATQAPPTRIVIALGAALFELEVRTLQDSGWRGAVQAMGAWVGERV